MANETPKWLAELQAAIPEPPTETVVVGGAEFALRGLTAKERDAFEQSIVDARGKKAKVNLENIRAKLLRRCIVSINGHPIPEDETSRTLLEVELGRRNAAEVNQLFEVAQRLSGLRPEDVEELAGN